MTEKTCPFFAAPQNGALACVNVRGDRICAVMCKSEFDFSTVQAFLFFCMDGSWTQTPSDCSGEINTKNNLNDDDDDDDTFSYPRSVFIAQDATNCSMLPN